MMVDAKSRICPVCNYEFAEAGTSLTKWVALILALILLISFILL